MDSTPPRHNCSPRFRAWVVLAAVMAASAVVRVPYFVNAEATFNSDEAVDALVILHLMRGQEMTLFNWDARYYGIVEGVMAVPLLGLGVPAPLACKLASFAGFLGLLAALFLLGRRLYGVREGLAAAALAAFFSPQVVMWSVTASGGYALVIAWGALALLQLARTLRRPDGGNFLALGAVLGFGLYIYELFLVYLVTIALTALCCALFHWRPAPAADGAARGAARPWRAALFLAAGFAAGISPKLAPWLGGAAHAGKQPMYMLASGAQVARNLRLLVFECLPSFFGANPARHAGLMHEVGYTSAPRALAGALLLGVYAAAWALALLRVGKRLAAPAEVRPAPEAVVELALVLLVAVTFVLFLVSPNPQDAKSNRYLLPLLSSLPLLAGRMLVGLARGAAEAAGPSRPRRPWGAWAGLAAWALGLLLVALPVLQIGSNFRLRGLLDARYRLVRRAEPLRAVVSFLAREGIAGAYSDYWTSYKATLLSGERVVVTPLADWDRHPAYTGRVDGLPSEAYIFPANSAQGGSLARRLAQGRRPFAVRRFGPYLVWSSPRHERLLAFVGHALPLREPRAAIAARVPPALAAGRTATIPTTVRNRGSATWPAEGRPDGWFKVDLSYRWSDAAGREVVSEGLRSPLPRDVEPGGRVELGVAVAAPAAPGRYRLLITVVQEGVCWFDRAGGGGGTYPVDVVAR